MQAAKRAKGVWTPPTLWKGQRHNLRWVALSHAHQTPSRPAKPNAGPPTLLGPNR